MLQITYVSTARDAGNTELLREIEAQAQMRNGAAGLSGLLIFDGHRFLQVLEGPEDVVLRTIARIKADPRHFALVILRERYVAQPSFGNWSMLCRDVSNSGETLGDLIAPLVADADKSTKALFASFAQIRDRAA